MAKENNILESVERYKTILEYINMGGEINEAGADPAAMGADPTAMGVDPNAMGADPAAMGADPAAMGADPTAMGADPTAMGADPNAAAGGVEGFDPQGADPNAAAEDPTAAAAADPTAMAAEDPTAEEPKEDKASEELADSQKDTEKKVGRISDKFDRLLDLLNDFTEKLDANSNDITSLKAEMEKRNPTPEEKLSLRSKDGYPFNVSVDDYWDNKEATSDYSTDDDRNGEGSQIYKITKSDIDGETDWPSISKSLDNDSFHMNLKDIMGF